MTKKETLSYEEELFEEIKSSCLYPSYDLRLANHDYHKTNRMSKIEGGAVVVIVDHENKRQVAYPNIKNTNVYTKRLRANFSANTNFCKRIDEIYCITENKQVKKLTA